MILVTLFLISCLALFIIRRKKSKQTAQAKDTSIPKKPIPGIPNLLQDAWTANDMINAFDELCDKYSEDGLASLMFGPIIGVVIWDPHLLETLSNCPAAQSKGEFYQLLLGRITNGIITQSGGQEWKELRKPLFHSLAKKYLENDYFNEFVHQTHCLIDFIKQNREGMMYDLQSDISASALDTFAMTHLGIRTHELIERKWNHSHIADHVFVMAIEELLAINNFYWRFITIFQKILFAISDFIKRFKFFKSLNHDMESRKEQNIKPLRGLFEETYLRISQLFERLAVFLRIKTMSLMRFCRINFNLSITESQRKSRELEVIAHRGIEWIFTTRKEAGIEAPDGLEYYSDFLLRRQKERNLKQSKVNKHLMDITIAGSDTTATVANAALFFIAMHSEVQERILKEQQEIFGDSGRDPTMEDINKMQYLERVIKETLRYICPAGVVKFTEEACQIGDYEIPKATLVFVFQKRIHRESQYYEKPNLFYPDHFLPEVEATRPPYAYIPFGTGIRKCPGFLYSLIQMKVLLSMIIRNFKIKTPVKMENTFFDYSILMTIRGGCPIEIVSREKNTS